jgi:hypothetical protein
MGMLVILVVALAPLALLCVAAAANRAKAIPAGILGVLVTGLLFAWTFSPGPVGEGEPHLGGMYDAIAKTIVRLYSTPLFALFALVLLWRLVELAWPRADDEPPPEPPVAAGAELPRAIAVDGTGRDVDRP